MMTSAGSGSLSMVGVVQKVYRAEGVLGFWAGYRPNIARTFLVNAAELGTYDEVSQVAGNGHMRFKAIPPPAQKSNKLSVVIGCNLSLFFV